MRTTTAISPNQTSRPSILNEIGSLIFSRKCQSCTLAKKQRFIGSWGLSDYDASLLVDSRSSAEYFEAVMKTVGGESESDQASFAKETANWLNGEMARLMHENDVPSTQETRVEPTRVSGVSSQVPETGD